MPIIALRAGASAGPQAAGTREKADMEIPTYQIHAVLGSLSRRLYHRSRSRDAGRGATAEDRRLQGVIERVSCRIIARITEAGLNREKTGAWRHLQLNRSGSGGDEPMRFQYSVLDPEGRRRHRSIPIEAASLLPATGSGGGDLDPES